MSTEDDKNSGSETDQSFWARDYLNLKQRLTEWRTDTTTV